MTPGRRDHDRTVGTAGTLRRDVSERQAIGWYIGASGNPGPVSFRSSYHAVLAEARAVTGRGPDGSVRQEAAAHAITWLGAIAYLCFLDQVGTALTLEGNATPNKGPSIAWCLTDFGPDFLTPRDVDALYALRCSLAHNYSLLNRGASGQRRLPHLDFHFSFHADPDRPMIEHASRQWDGDLTTEPGGDTQTSVNLWALGDAAEYCHRSVQTAFSRGELVARLPPIELLLRYTIVELDGEQ